MTEEGIEFVTEANIGVDIDVNVLRANTDALVLALGATVPRDLPVKVRSLTFPRRLHAPCALTSRRRRRRRRR